MRNFKFIVLFFCHSAAILSCEKAPLQSTDTFLPTDKAFVRIALLSPGTPNVMIKADDVKLNGNTTPGYGGIFPATFSFPDYAAVPANGTFKLSLANTGTQNDSVVLFNTKLDVQAGKFYALTLSDTGINRTAFLIEDQFVLQKDSFLSVRLINAMVGSLLNLIRVDSATATDVVRDTLARNIPYKGTSGFISVRTITTRPFIRIRVTSATDGISIGASQIPPQTLATGSRRSITYYAAGFINGTVAPYTPTIFSAVTNQ
ncbi:MAG: hypothetical protein ACR2KX_09075 [Chitinophagaceae bacterium]